MFRNAKRRTQHLPAFACDLTQSRGGDGRRNRGGTFTKCFKAPTANDRRRGDIISCGSSPRRVFQSCHFHCRFRVVHAVFSRYVPRQGFCARGNPLTANRTHLHRKIVASFTNHQTDHHTQKNMLPFLELCSLGRPNNTKSGNRNEAYSYGRNHTTRASYHTGAASQHPRTSPTPPPPSRLKLPISPHLDDVGSFACNGNPQHRHPRAPP